MTGELFGAKWKIKMDSYIPHEAIVDLKVVQKLRDVSYKNGWKQSFIEKWGYDLQLGIYQEIVRQNTGESLPCIIAAVDKQEYALWNVLQKRKFRYSSVSNTSLSSNVVYSQRVRTFDDALESSQINCVDGSVLFASLLRAINIEPILVRTPGHMFVGYYTDNSHKDMNFLETTMIGDVDLDDFFPDEQLDSTMVGKSQNQMSLLTFEKSKQYANKKYKENEKGIHSGKLNYMFLEISKDVRRRIQPIGK